MQRVLYVIVISSLVACSHSKPPVQSVALTTPPPPVPTAPRPSETATIPASDGLAVSEELARACALHFDVAPQAPKFDFDRSALQPGDRNVLDQVATCLTTGALKGRAVELVGRADPRGTEEYNLGLGLRRAATVRDYLQRLGVAPGQLGETTRGALDATGVDETGWQADRRVDLKLSTI